MYARCPFHASAGQLLVVKENMEAGNWVPVGPYAADLKPHALQVAARLNGRAKQGFRYHVVDDQSEFQTS